jgi:hypothetical protein
MHTLTLQAILSFKKHMGHKSMISPRNGALYQKKRGIAAALQPMTSNKSSQAVLFPILINMLVPPHAKILITISIIAAASTIAGL